MSLLRNYIVSFFLHCTTHGSTLPFLFYLFITLSLSPYYNASYQKLHINLYSFVKISSHIPSKILQVLFPTIPSCTSPCAFCRFLTAFSVPPPKIPSTLPQSYPVAFSFSCTNAVRFPFAPFRIVGQPASVFFPSIPSTFWLLNHCLLHSACTLAIQEPVSTDGFV